MKNAILIDPHSHTVMLATMKAPHATAAVMGLRPVHGLAPIPDVLYVAADQRRLLKEVPQQVWLMDETAIAGLALIAGPDFTDILRPMGLGWIFPTTRLRKVEKSIVWMSPEDAQRWVQEHPRETLA